MSKKKNNKCGNCGKSIPSNQKFCNEECLREYFKKKKDKEFERIKDGDLNIHLIQLALKEKIEISVTPKRTHTVKGIPIRFDNDTYRIYIETEKAIESVLLSSVSHYVFPKKLFNLLLKEN